MTDAFLNGTHMPANFDYITPSSPFTVNGHLDPTSQRFHVSIITPNGAYAYQDTHIQDTCELGFSQRVPDDPPFNLR